MIGKPIGLAGVTRFRIFGDESLRGGTIQRVELGLLARATSSRAHLVARLGRVDLVTDQPSDSRCDSRRVLHPDLVAIETTTSAAADAVDDLCLSAEPLSICCADRNGFCVSLAGLASSGEVICVAPGAIHGAAPDGCGLTRVGAHDSAWDLMILVEAAINHGEAF